MTKSMTPATLLCDFYKISHRAQYPKGTEIVYSTWTPRTSRIPNIDKVVCFGIQGFIKKYLVDYFNENFFNRKIEDICKEYKRFISCTLGDKNPDTSHIEALHDLCYLPVVIECIPEGTLVPIKVPMMTIYNTHPDFFWLTNYLETLISCEIWMPMTSATIAYQYRQLLDKYANETNSAMKDFVPWQGHDFSLRGMGSIESGATSGAGHLLSFTGTDSCPAICYLEKYYNANIESELVGGSVPASEHSVMCSSGKDNEFDCYKRLITEVYPNGIVSIVSDTWDLWHVIDSTIRTLKPQIMSRDGKVVIRPDSGDPVKIICGDDSSSNPLVKKGVIELLWDIFGGVTTAEGYKQLDPHIGAIYGDAITLDRCEQICSGLKAKGFASTNMVFGIGSFTYQYNTRDTFGFALKSTYVRINKQGYNIFKDPVTDNGVKKSQTGVVRVYRDNDGNIKYEDNLPMGYYPDGNILKTIFKNGDTHNTSSLKEIRDRLLSNNNA